MEQWSFYWHPCVCILTGEEVSVAVGLATSLLIVGHGRHLLGRGAAHGLTLWNLSSSHSHLAKDRDKHHKMSNTAALLFLLCTLWISLLKSTVFQTNWANQCKMLHTVFSPNIGQLLRFASENLFCCCKQYWQFRAGSCCTYLFRRIHLAMFWTSCIWLWGGKPKTHYFLPSHTWCSVVGWVIIHQ